MQDARAVQVTVYLRESDQWRGKPLPLAILSYLRTENALAACIVQSVGGISRTSIGYHQPPDFDVGPPIAYRDHLRPYRRARETRAAK